MRAKLIKIAVTLLALVMATVAIQIAAVGDGGGVLYIYTDPQRTTLVTIDSNGRYYVAPGTEYYFTIQGITEYNVGTEITIWTYRVDTNENITMHKLVVSSNPFDAVFTWTIPEAWLDEVVRIKYGRNLENEWFYAQKEIRINARVGTGILWAYTDSDRTIEAPLDNGENYLVYPSATYYFRITEISEYESVRISVWAFYSIGRDTHNILVTSGKTQPTIEFEWTIPSWLPVETSIKFKYGIWPKEPGPTAIGPKPAWYFARRETQSGPRLLLVVPGVFLGSVGAISALFSSLGLKVLLTKRKH